MARPAGRRNADFDEKADELLGRLAAAWMQLGPGASLRELAMEAGTSQNNVRHYFGDREALFAAVLARVEAEGSPHMRAAEEPRGADAESALRYFLEQVVGAWARFGVGRMHAVTLAEGLSGEGRGPLYIQHVLEPTLQTLERLLERLVADGALPPMDARVGALALLGPLVLALLHQDNLGGWTCRPLDLSRALETHLQGWLHGYGAAGAKMRA